MTKERVIDTFMLRCDYIFNVIQIPRNDADIALYAWREITHHPKKMIKCALLGCKRNAACVCYASSINHRNKIAILLCTTCANFERCGKIKVAIAVVAKIFADRVQIYKQHPNLLPYYIKPDISDCDTENDEPQIPRKRARCSSV
jgi:hypothetical protein